jgi:ATP-binding cassette, subfamily F, member 2
MTFVNTVTERNVCLSRLKAANDMKKEKLREFISRDGKKYDNPAHQAQRKMKMKQLEDLDDVEDVEIDPELTIHLPKPFGVFDAGEKLITIADVSFAWPGETPLFEAIDFSIFPKDRVVILGKNGCGKTSLLNLLIGESNPTTGSVSKHLGCRVTVKPLFFLALKRIVSY